MIRKHYKTLVFCCLISLQQLAAQVDHWETIIFNSDNWKYTIPNASTPSNWIQPGFNDGSWLNGAGGFGFADGDDNTVLPSGTISVFQRISFTVSNPGSISKLTLNMDYDDGFVAYLNGVEIARAYMSGSGQPAYNATASGLHEAVMYQGGYPDQFELSAAQTASLLVTGINVLCIQTHNESAGSSDFSSLAWLHAGMHAPGTTFSTPPNWFNAPVDFTQSTLPIIVINTGGQAIPDEPKINATMGIIHNGSGNINHITDTPNEYNGNIAIEQRGSSSAGFPQKSWGLETRMADQLTNNDVSIFGWPADNDWILYAPYTDKSLIRNVLTYHIGSQLGRWAPRTQACEVVLNGEYQGVYIFMEKIKRDSGRVAINKLNYDDTLNNGLTGGYIIKVDKTTGGTPIAWTSPYQAQSPSNSLIHYQLHEPELDTIHPTQLQYIEDFVTAWETALSGPNFTDPSSGYKAYINVESFIDFLLMNEVTKNVDGYRISTFLYKERQSEGGKLVAGPLWDFNLGLGNADYCEGGLTTGWEIDFNNICAGGYDNPFWWKRLLEDPDFSKRVHCRWMELRLGPLHLDTLYAYLQEMYTLLDTPADRHFAKWPILGTYVWPNNFIGNTFEEEMNYLSSWLTARIGWMDANMFSSCPDFGINEDEQVFTIFPNPTSHKVAISGIDLQGSHVQLKEFSGKTLQELKADQQTLEISLDSVAPGCYFILIESAAGRTKTLKIIKH